MTDKTAIEQVMTAFEEFKATNDAAIVELKKKGVNDPIVTEKLGKIEATLASFEEANQKATAAILEAKKVAEDEKAHVDELEAKLNRLSLAGSADPATREDERKHRANEWLKAAVGAITKGEFNLTADQQKTLNDVKEEYKAMSVGNDTTGGYLAPLEYVREIIKGVTEISPVRSMVRVRQTATKGIQIPKRTGQFAARWVAEQEQRSETDGLRYGMWEIPVHEIYALVDISEQNLEDSAFDMEAEIRFEANEQFAVAEGAAVVSGNGVGKPQGFLDASAGLAETVSGDATKITADGLLTLKHGIKTAYTRNAVFALNRTSLGSVRKLKDTTGQYLWMPGIALGKPNSIDGDPYVELPDMPNEAAGSFPVAYGDFARAYTLVDRIQMSILRDPYTQATSGNIRYIFRKRQGGQVVLAEALRKLKVAVS